MVAKPGLESKTPPLLKKICFKCPLRTEADHESAITRIEELWGCQSGTPEGDELEVLIKLAWAYENDHHKIEAPRPESLLEYRLDQIGLLADDIDRVMAFRKKAPDILQKESGFSSEIISLISAIPLTQKDIVNL